jgi:hypothetical protein
VLVRAARDYDKEGELMKPTAAEVHAWLAKIASETYDPDERRLAGAALALLVERVPSRRQDGKP